MTRDLYILDPKRFPVRYEAGTGIKSVGNKVIMYYPIIRVTIRRDLHLYGIQSGIK